MKQSAVKQNPGGWRRTALLLVVCLLLPLCPARAAGPEVIRVGYPLQAGLTELDEHGNYSGYTYEYLQELAQYTGWEYEFVTLEGGPDEVLVQMLEMLRRGELDLMVNMNYSDALAELYDYPGYCYGTAYSVLAVLEENTAVNESNLQAKPEVRIAVLETAGKRNAALDQFCRMNGITAQYIPCEDDLQQMEKLRSGEADALLSVDVSIPEGLRVIAKFTPQLFYFATTRGNSAIVSKLNSAILAINDADPYFTVRLYEKYFASRRTGLYLTAEERSYTRGRDTLRVAYIDEKAPIQDSNADGAFTGIAREVFDYIQEATGQSFQYIRVSNPDELEQLLKSGGVDLAAGIPYNYEDSRIYGVALTRPYLETQVVMVLGSGVDAGSLAGKRLALPKGVVLADDYEGEVIWYHSIAECIQAVDRGQADCAYGNGYSIQYYANEASYRNITLVPQSSMMQQISIGVAKPADTVLLSILNKAIGSIPEGELQAMVYRNAVPERHVTLFDFIADNPWLSILSVLVVAGIVVLILALHYHTKMKLSRQAALEAERYAQLCELTNEHIFEYDFAKDRMALTQRSAEALGVGRVRERYLEELYQGQSPERAEERAVCQSLMKGNGGTEELLCSFPDGSRRWFRISAKILRDGTGKPLYTIGKLSDIQSDMEERQRLEERAQRDSLTELYNAAATRSLVSVLLNAPETMGVLLIIDVDHFKEVNDANGHFVGDQVLMGLAKLMERTFRKGDILGRLGGDEFLVYLTGVTDGQVVENKCRQLLDGVALVGQMAGEVDVTLSIGAAVAQPGEIYDLLYRRADEALYRVKHQGRNGAELVEADDKGGAQ